MNAPPRPTLIESAAGALLRRVTAIPGLESWVRNPLVVLVGYRLATAVGCMWGGVLSTGRLEQRGGVIVASGCPRWAFGRGGTTIGAVYLTNGAVSSDVLEHEVVHRAQWRRYGLWFVVLYLAAGPVAERNRFEVEAGLEKGGYR